MLFYSTSAYPTPIFVDFKICANCAKVPIFQRLYRENKVGDHFFSLFAFSLQNIIFENKTNKKETFIYKLTMNNTCLAKHCFNVVINNWSLYMICLSGNRLKFNVSLWNSNCFNRYLLTFIVSHKLNLDVNIKSFSCCHDVHNVFICMVSYRQCDTQINILIDC